MMKTPFISRNLKNSKILNSSVGSVTLWLIAGGCFVIVLAGVAFWFLYGLPKEDEKPSISRVKKADAQQVKKFSIPVRPTPEPVTSESESAKETPSVSNGSSPAVNESNTIAATEKAQAEGVSSSSPQPKNDLEMEDLPPEDSPRKETAPDALKSDPNAVSSPERKESVVDSSKSESEEAPANKGGDVKVQGDNSKISPQESGEELVVIVEVGNVREGPSTGERVLFTVEQGHRLRINERKGNWYAVVLKDGRTGWVHHSLLGDAEELAARQPKGGTQKSAKNLIKGIRTVVTDPNHAQIIFELNGYNPPEIMVLEGEKPRVVCDFYAAKLGPEVGRRIRVDNSVLEKIRVGFHKGGKPKVRVVLDLKSGQNYSVEQFFFEQEKYYALMINAGQ